VYWYPQLGWLKLVSWLDGDTNQKKDDGAKLSQTTRRIERRKIVDTW